MITGRFVISDARTFPLPGTNGKFRHLATVLCGTREYIAFMSVAGGTTYVEEITGGHLEQIKDDNLWEDLVKFLQERQILSYAREQ